MQTSEDNQTKLVQCGSAALTPTQQRYATVELECLAIQWAVIKCDFYLRGLPHFEVHTDHRPLEGIFKKGISEMQNARLMRMREKLVAYNFKVLWVEGKNHKIADALSRYPVFDPKEDGEHLHAEEADAPNVEDDDEEIDTAVDYCKRTNSGVNNMSFIIENIDQGYRHLVQQIKEDNMTDRKSKKLKHDNYNGNEVSGK